ncbi:MAG: Sulfotransferase domain protein [Gemmataceae bacterium]|nr:Sulfotransferase domain protein [Gemmataceae bacterium]
MTPAAALADSAPAAGPKPLAKAGGKEWSPRIWDGMDFVGWLRLLARNRFAVHPPHWYIAASISVISVGHMVLRWVQGGLYGDRIARTPIPDHPIFVIGHWRTGTTLLHELMILDDRFSYPDTYACLEPNHTLLTERFFKTYGNWLLPDRRPMDNMAAGWARPQEDEFALCLLGLPSPYTDFAFPNRPPIYPGSLDLSGLTPAQLVHWKRTFRRYLQTLTFKDPRRLVLKSPPHTARVRVLLELFPGARFVHVVRDPYVVFPSTVNLWKSLGRKHGLQSPRNETAIREKVFREFRVIYDRLEEAKGLIPAGRFHELRYESLVKDPVAEMRKVYAGIGLDGYEEYRPKLENYLAKNAGYETNKYQLPDADREEINRRWGDVIRRYGYS